MTQPNNPTSPDFPQIPGDTIVETLYLDTATLTPSHAPGTQSSSSGSTSISATLDLATVLKASQTLSSEIQLDKLLATLLHTVLENAGADKGALLMPRESQWFVEAVATGDQPTLMQSIALSSSSEVPQSLINTVKRTRQPVVIVDALAHPTLATDAYVVQQQPRSLLCTPILNQGKLVAILYLENYVTVGAFTSDRVQLLNILCAQVAISLENARLYDLQQDKNQALEESLKRLNQSELRFQRLFEQSADAILLLGAEGFIDCNQASMELFGYSHKSNLCNIHPSRLSPEFQPDGQTSFEKANTMIAHALEFGSHQFEWVHQRANQEVFWADVLLTVVVYDGVQILHSLVRDVSNRIAVEAAIQQKSHELEQALQNLQNTQLQMVQAEKMASLGNLVAGVAHEINNPIGFLNGSVQNAKDYLQDLLTHLELYQQHYPNPVTAIQDHSEEIDLAFLTADLSKLLNSMTGAIDRIKGISTSLRTFSRADTEHKVSANLHDGLDSTILILKYRLKANEHRPAIEVTQNYGTLPTIECFPGQLNQVFMNILANAIDIFDEMAQAPEFKATEADQQSITITTVMLDHQAEIRISDNGKGMPETVKQKIFDHLFTTKAVGKGTGLGLAIARQIVVEKHGGQLIVESAIGQSTEFIIRLPIA
jgi:PAS domain S-box-containing protein